MDFLVDLFAHRSIVGSDGTAHAGRLRHDVVAHTTAESGHRHHGRRFGDVDLTGDDRLQGGDDMRAHDDRINPGPRSRAMRLPARHHNIETLGAGKCSLGSVVGGTRYPALRDMQTKDGIHVRTFQDAFAHHEPGAALFAFRRTFFGGLEDEFDRAGKLLAYLAQHAGRTH